MHGTQPNHPSLQGATLVCPPPEDDASRAVWQEARMDGIGASEIASVLGRGWDTPLKVWWEKRSRTSTFKGNKATAWGLFMEPTLARWYTETTGEELALTGLWRSKDRAWQMCSPDRFLVRKPRGVEFKTGGAETARAWDGGVVPDFYMPQVQQSIDVTGFDEWDVVYSVGGYPPEIITVKRDEDMIAEIREAGAAMWEMIRSGVQPKVQGSLSEKSILAAANPFGDDSAVELSFAGMLALNEYREARKLKGQYGRVQDAAGVRLREALGDAKIGTDRGEKACWLEIYGDNPVPKLYVS